MLRQPATASDEDARGRWPAPHLQAAVRSHLVSDVPVGAFLSGGIDSATVVGTMAERGRRADQTFSIGFERTASTSCRSPGGSPSRFGTEHRELMVEPGHLGSRRAARRIRRTVRRLLGDPNLPRLAARRQHVKVVLSGDGGDEIFAGYERYRVDHQRRWLGLLGDMHLGAPLRAVSNLLPVGGGRNILHHLSLPRTARYLESMSLFRDHGLQEAFGSNCPEIYSLAPLADRDLDPLSRLQDLDMKSYLPSDILTKVDRMSMANSLEARVPLLDHRLVEFACALPVDLRMRGGAGKYLLKRALQGRIPADLLTRPKQGFGVPLEAWFSGSIRGFFRDQIGDARRLGELGIARDVVQRLHQLFEDTGRRDYCDRLWALVVLDRSLQRLRGATA